MKSRSSFKSRQTKEWENACLETRRNLEKRKNRLSQFHLRITDHILDLGCGDGLNLKILRKMGMKNLVGLDISPDLLKRAQKNNPQVEFYQGSAENLPFKNGQFDVCLVDSVFHHLLDYEQPLKEIRRVLALGGRLCFIEPHQSFLRSLLDFVCRLPLSRFIPFLKKRRNAYLGEITLMKHWLKTEDEFFTSLRRHHFQEVFCRPDFLSIIGEFQKD